MKIRAKNFKLSMMILADATLLAASLIGACFLRFNRSGVGRHMDEMLSLATVVVPAGVAVFALFGLYRGLWRDTGASDLWRIAQACLIAMLFAFTYAFLLRLHLSRSVLLIDGILTFLLESTLRVGIRTFYEARTNPEGLKAYKFADRKIRACPLCGCVSQRVHLPPSERTLGCIYSVH